MGSFTLKVRSKAWECTFESSMERRVDSLGFVTPTGWERESASTHIGAWVNMCGWLAMGANLRGGAIQVLRPPRDVRKAGDMWTCADGRVRRWTDYQGVQTALAMCSETHWGSDNQECDSGGYVRMAGDTCGGAIRGLRPPKDVPRVTNSRSKTGLAKCTHPSIRQIALADRAMTQGCLVGSQQSTQSSFWVQLDGGG